MIRQVAMILTNTTTTLVGTSSILDLVSYVQRFVECFRGSLGSLKAQHQHHMHHTGTDQQQQTLTHCMLV